VCDTEKADNAESKVNLEKIIAKEKAFLESIEQKCEQNFNLGLRN
jgi:hypothetical protein